MLSGVWAATVPAARALSSVVTIAGLVPEDCGSRRLPRSKPMRIEQAAQDSEGSRPALPQPLRSSWPMPSAPLVEPAEHLDDLGPVFLELRASSAARPAATREDRCGTAQARSDYALVHVLDLGLQLARGGDLLGRDDVDALCRPPSPLSRACSLAHELAVASRSFVGEVPAEQLGAEVEGGELGALLLQLGRSAPARRATGPPRCRRRRTPCRRPAMQVPGLRSSAAMASCADDVGLMSSPVPSDTVDALLRLSRILVRSAASRPSFLLPSVNCWKNELPTPRFLESSPIFTSAAKSASARSAAFTISSSVNFSASYPAKAPTPAKSAGPTMPPSDDARDDAACFTPPESWIFLMSASSPSIALPRAAVFKPLPARCTSKSVLASLDPFASAS